MSLVLYIVNDNPAYIAMLGNSIRMLRKFSNIEARVIFVENNESRRRSPEGADVTAYIIDTIPEKQLPVRSKEQLIDYCEQMGVELWLRRLPEIEEPDYAPVHRMLIEECKEDKVLFLDADTFIFDDVNELFDIYRDYDFAATPNLFAINAQVINYDDVPYVMIGDVRMKPFNSGVIVWNNGWCHRWAATIYDYCRSLGDGSHPLSEWVKTTNSLSGREELACNLFVIDYKLKTAYLDIKHCCLTCMSVTNKPYIFHSTCPKYREYFNQINLMHNRKFKLVKV